MATEMEDAGVAGGGLATAEEVKPYRIHVSSRYLNLTKQKLEITRLPHEQDEPKSKDWWQPKSQVEPLIDFWLEQYQWRDQEELMNDDLPQFRTGFTVPQVEAPIRIHFIHVRSPHENAIPLLLIPPFPFSNLSLGHLVKRFTDPEDAEHNQPFHLVVPSLPGLGFSDALPTNTAVVSSTADLFNLLMKRLSYSFYLVTNAMSGTASPAEIDYKLAECLATRYPDSCLGTHFISPPLTQPKLQEAPLEWAKWSIASFFKAPILGYRTEDFSALKHSGYVPPSKKLATPAQFGLNRLGLSEPNTLAYALCDSPTGLLVFVMKGLRLLAPQKEFTPTEIINFTQLAWLPGPESAMRFWAHCLRHPEKADKKPRPRPRVALTVFLGDEQEAPRDENDGNGGRGIPELFNGEKHSYSCPSWARTKYNVLYTNRATGKPGLLAWERPEIITAGVQALAAATLKIDDRLKPSARPETARLEQVVVGVDAAGLEEQVAAPELPEPSPEPSPALLAPPKIGERLHPVREISDDTKVASDENLVAKTPSPIPATPSPIQVVPPTVTVKGS
ncbi:alpha/beta-hydrolase [Xylariaceae sp. FL1651]|nr:alpha/beta-hydrolase [Xylariaceae sp. FL1651]